MTLKLDPKLPLAYNGLGTLEHEKEILESPREMRVAIIYYDCPKITTDTFAVLWADDPTIRIRRIEPITGEDEEAAKEILERVYADRLGIDAIPFDFEADVKDNGTSGSDILKHGVGVFVGADAKASDVLK